jgi:hypothetical protein
MCWRRSVDGEGNRDDVRLHAGQERCF